MKKLLALIVTCCLLLSGFGFAAAEGQDIVLLYTNDVHCGVEDNLGYAGLVAYANQLRAEGQQVVLIDAGDAVQGAAIGTLSNGEYLVDIMNHAGYEIAVPGNHEFDYGMDQFFALREKAEYPYLSCNFTDLRTGEAVLDAYLIKDFGGLKIAFVGICTPQTITSSTPAYFQNENGEFIYGFQQDETGEALYACVQKAVDAARAEGADLVVAVAHLGIDETSSPWTSSELIANTTGIDALIDGHSHSVVGTKVLNKEGKPVVHGQTGTKLANIGQMTISADGSRIESALVTSYTGSDADMEAFVADIKAQYEEVLKEVVAKTDVDLITVDPATNERIIRNADSNLGDLCADAYKTVSGADVAFVNGGGIRADIPAGDITYEQIIAVHPYGNMLTVVEATGQQILDCLEYSAYSWPSEFGGFQHVAGLTYEIHTYIESGVTRDENGMYIGVDGEYRVQNVMVNGEPLDLEKTYTVASHNYMLKQGGDGFNMFVGDKILQDEVMLDNQVLITYIRDYLDGVVGEEYGDIYGQGRITFVNEKP